VGLADGGAELFGVLKRLQFRLLVGGEEAGGLFPELGVGGIKLFTNGGDFEDRFADSGSIRTAVGDGGLQGLRLAVRAALLAAVMDVIWVSERLRYVFSSVKAGAPDGGWAKLTAAANRARARGVFILNSFVFSSGRRIIRSLCRVERGREGGSWLRIG
jgi:hypothetical protein